MVNRETWIVALLRELRTASHESRFTILKGGC